MTVIDPASDDDRRVVEALRAVGLELSSIYDLVITDKKYAAAIPVLLSLLSQNLDDNIKEGIVRALTVPEARGTAAKPLLKEFERLDSSSSLKWVIANALEVVADESVFEDIVRLARDKRQGESRQMLVLSLAKFKDPRAGDVLIEILNDDEVAGHALITLGKLGVRGARRRIEPFLNHPLPWVRTEAKRALARLDKADRGAKVRRPKAGSDP